MTLVEKERIFTPYGKGCINVYSKRYFFDEQAEDVVPLLLCLLHGSLKKEQNKTKNDRDRSTKQ